jgi:chaperonin GroES
MTPNITLIKNRVLIKPDAKDTKHGSIVIPEAYQQKQDTGLVLAVGKGKRNKKTGALEPMQTKAGDKIIYLSDQCEPVKLDGQDLVMINDHEVMAVIE